MVMHEAEPEPGPLACTVIVCTYNRADRLPFCLEALAAQDLDPDCFELIVVDNASKDNTRAVVEAWLPKFRHARYVYEATVGLSSARNRGIAEARGDIIAFTDDDCIPDRSWLSATLAAFEAAPRAGVVVGKIIPDFAEAPPQHWLDMKLAGLVLSCLDYADEVCELPLESVRGASVAFRRQAVAEAGHFRTDLGLKGGALLGNEETEFCMRLQQRGYTLMYTPFASVRHFIPQSRTTQTYFLDRWFGQGQADYRTEHDGVGERPPVSAAAASLDALTALARYFLARRRLSRLRRIAGPALTPDLFNRICMLSRDAGARREQMAHMFGRMALRLRRAPWAA